MTYRHSRWIAAVVMLVACMMLVPADVASARRKKNMVTATVDGAPMKWKGHYVVMTRGQAGVFIIATKRARPGKILPTIGFSCAVDLSTLTLPATVTLGCFATYTETRVGGSFETRSWLSHGEAVAVTFETFDGTRVTGSASGVLDPVLGADASITVDGAFSGKIVLDDD